MSMNKCIIIRSYLTSLLGILWAEQWWCYCCFLRLFIATLGVVVVVVKCTLDGKPLLS